MAPDDEELKKRMAAWLEGLTADLPGWEDLPGLGLYMDQVILLLSHYLRPLYQNEDDKSITASIINNYVRLKLLPPPVKKKYSRVHIAYLIVICALKQSLSISCIQQILPTEQGEDATREMYEDFLRQYREAAAYLRRSLIGGDLPVGRALVSSAAVFSTLSKGLTCALLRVDDGGEKKAKAKEKEKITEKSKE